MDGKTGLLSVIVKDPNGIQYEGQARSVSSYSETGIFDILPSHANFVGIIKKSLIVVEKNNQKTTMPVETGIIKVHKNTVTVLYTEPRGWRFFAAKKTSEKF